MERKQIGATLYQLDSKDKVRVWSIYVEANGDLAEIHVQTGLEDGKKTESVINVDGKNAGKKNATTPFEQAVKEAEARVIQQVRKGYVSDRTRLKSKDELGSGLKSPMLAEKYDPTMKQKGSRNLEKLGLVGQMVAIQPKLDGNRCPIVNTFGAYNSVKAVAHTRKGDAMPVQLSHILRDVEAQISAACWSPGLQDVTTDGELYDHLGMPFDELNGVMKKVTPNAEEKAKQDRIKYHVYDILLPGGFEQRHETLRSILKTTGNIEVVRTEFVTATEETLREKLEEVLALGYEGLIIRQLGKPYEHKRTWQLLKYKQFEDFEAEVVDVEEDKRGGFGAAIVLKLNPPSKDADGKPITTFKAGISGFSQDFMKEVFVNKQKYIGKQATITHFGRSQYNVPRFGKFKAFR